MLISVEKISCLKVDIDSVNKIELGYTGQACGRGVYGTRPELDNNSAGSGRQLDTSQIYANTSAIIKALLSSDLRNYSPATYPFPALHIPVE
jgi:hypothetical protein